MRVKVMISLGSESRVQYSTSQQWYNRHERHRRAHGPILSSRGFPLVASTKSVRHTVVQLLGNHDNSKAN